MSPIMPPMSQNASHMEKWRSTLNNEIVQSPCKPISMPEGTLIERILRSLRVHASNVPGTPAVIEACNQDRRLTHLQIHDRALSVAAFLTAHGFSIGDRLTAALPNCIEWPVLHLGTWAAGGVVVGSSADFSLYETVYQLQDSGSSVVICAEGMLATMMEAAKLSPTLKTIVCVRSSSDKLLPEGVIDFEEALQYEPLKEIAQVTPDAACIIFYTSGTSGKPKGVIHTHRSFHCAVETVRSHWLNEVYPVLGIPNVDLYKEPQIVYTSCYHILGFIILNWNLINGSPAVLLRTFNGEVYLRSIDQFKPRYLIMAPPVFMYLAKEVAEKRAALASVEMIMCGAAPLSKELSDEFQSRHPTVKYVVQAYGMTELGFAHVPLLLEEGVNASAGVVTYFFEQTILDPVTGLPCKQGQRGEVCLRGPPQTIGYLNKPEATKELIDEEGWVHTGDVGYIDDRGLLYIVDRIKELIKVYYKNQTRQVPPAELEGVLLSCKRIKDAAIVGIPDVTRGELVRAFVVKADDNLSEQEVEDLVSVKLAEFKRITGGVCFVDAIPKSPAGKILRRVLRERA